MQHGYLKFDPVEAKENYWQPLTADPECQAVDYMSMFTAEGEPSPLMDFARNRTGAFRCRASLDGADASCGSRPVWG